MLVRDSSLYFNSEVQNIKRLSGDIKVGITKSVQYDEAFGSVIYLVEVTTHGLTYILNCRLMSRFGDVHNYEEWGRRSIHIPNPTGQKLQYSQKVGEVVLVAHIGGSTSDGVILGSLSHPARKSKLQPNDVVYYSEFNGLETSIDKDGAYKVTFKGTPITVSSLISGAASGAIPGPQYNPMISGSYLSFDKDGNFIVADSGPQSQMVQINKSGGSISIKSGSTTMKLSGMPGSVEITTGAMDLVASRTFSLSTKMLDIDATASLKLKSPKVAIGYGGVELVDTLIKIIDAIGTLVVSSPVGPCSPVQTAPSWAQLVQIKTQLSSIKGSL